MAYKSLFSKKFLPFHEQAAGKPWHTVEDGLQRVVLALMKVSGLGFLVVGLLLIIFPIIKSGLVYTHRLKSRRKKRRLVYLTKFAIPDILSFPCCNWTI
jgi:hypothetical protein